MEGMTAATTTYNLINALGIPATIMIAAVVIFFIVKDLKKDVSSCVKSVGSLGERLDKKIETLKVENELRDEKTIERLEGFERELKALERDSVTREQLYKETEGWRTEIMSLRNEISSLPYRMIEVIKNVRGNDEN